ncbi:hypothetical protein QP162_13270 [Sphingomonas aurantiaca]|uniref:hypothetical protein n=1 Tax=Sphingomonas aurantiaca TaxID=185949 RepID=UPI002FE0487A
MRCDINAFNADTFEKETPTGRGIVIGFVALNKPRGLPPLWKFREIPGSLNKQPSQKYFILSKAQAEYDKRLVKYYMEPSTRAGPVYVILRGK